MEKLPSESSAAGAMSNLYANTPYACPVMAPYRIFFE